MKHPQALRVAWKRFPKKKFNDMVYHQVKKYAVEQKWFGRNALHLSPATLQCRAQTPEF